MPVPKPKAGESQDDYIPRCISFLENEEKEKPKGDRRPHKQIQAICFETWRDSKRGAGAFRDGEPIPILRSFEKDGKKYIYGYGAIFDSPDYFGTIMTRGVVDSSIDHLRKFPAIRFMHKKPLGQLVFDREVEGLKTFVDQHGHHLLIEVYDGMEHEWNMIRKGGWGLSYGFMPARTGGIGRKCFEAGAFAGKCFDSFEKGRIYEYSIVDSPAHPDAVAYVMTRIVNGHKGETVSKTRTEKKENKLEKAEIEQLLKDSEERILAAVDKKLGDKKAETSLEDSLKGLEERLLAYVDDKVGKIEPPEPTHVEKTFDEANKKLKAMEDKIKSLKTIKTQLDTVGETSTALTERITQLEKEREKFANGITTTVETTVKKHFDAFNKRLGAIENAPDYHSPATGVPPILRGHDQGFRGMLDAAFRGKE